MGTIVYWFHELSYWYFILQWIRWDGSTSQLAQSTVVFPEGAVWSLKNVFKECHFIQQQIGPKTTSLADKKKKNRSVKCEINEFTRP